MTVNASTAMEIAELLSDALIEAGIRVRWGPAASTEPETLIRGTALEHFLVDPWPKEHLELL